MFIPCTADSVTSKKKKKKTDVPFQSNEKFQSYQYILKQIIR